MNLRPGTKSVAIGLMLLLAGCAPSGASRQASTPPAPSPAPAAPAPPAAIEETPAQRDARMAWWREARFGMFVHWGIYAVPAGRWPGYDSKNIGEWIQRNAKIPVYEYERLAKRFNPVRFDAAEWVSVAKDAGCRYIVVTSKHHDGFAMYDSAASNYDIVDSTPYKRDPMRSLAAETRRQGLQMCFYYSIWDWHNADFRKDRMPLYTGFMKEQLKELVTGYGPLGVLWFDGEWPDEWTEEMGKDLYTYVRALQPSVIVNNRVGKARDDMAGISKYKGAGDYDTPEQEVPSRGLPGVDWETCMTMNDTWGYKLDDHNWKSSTQLIRTLVEVASKGGNFLLNVGPDAQGVIPPESVKLMREIGRWMRINDDAIYGTTASPFERSPWGRATQKIVDGRPVLYLHVFDWPTTGELRIPGLKSSPRSVRVLGSDTRITGWRSEGQDLVIPVPSGSVHPAATVLELTYDASPEVAPVPVAYQKQGADGAVTLKATDADLPGRAPRIEKREAQDNLGFWTDAAGVARWHVEVARPGELMTTLVLACTDESAGDAYTLTCRGESGQTAELSGVVPSTGGWGNFTSVRAGRLSVPSPGKYVFEIRPSSAKLRNGLMNLRQIELVPAPAGK
jgi:alpha-L-fucosidase